MDLKSRHLNQHLIPLSGAVLGRGERAAHPRTYLRDYHMTPPCQTEVPRLIGRNVETQHPGMKTVFTMELDYVAGLKIHHLWSSVAPMSSQRKSLLGHLQIVPGDVVSAVHFIKSPP